MRKYTSTDTLSITVLGPSVHVHGHLYYQIALNVCYTVLLTVTIHFSPIGSNWVCIIDTGLTSQRKTVEEVIMDVLQMYDPESAEGAKKAIKDIEAKFGEMATIKEQNIRSSAYQSL